MAGHSSSQLGVFTPVFSVVIRRLTGRRHARR
jgi:hypothetical protein